MAQTQYGFIDLESLFNSRIEEVGTVRVFKAVKESAAEYTRVCNAIVADWAKPTETAQEEIDLPGDGTLQPLDEHGNPLPVQSSGSYKVAYPIQGAGTAWGDDRVSRELMTVEEANAATEDANRRDMDWIIRHMLAAVYTNTTWTYKDKVGPTGKKGLGDIVIQPLANGDSVLYNRKGNTEPATDNHYLAQAADIADSTNPYIAIDAALSHHPSNGNRRILCYIPTDLVEDTMALTSFIEVDEPDVVVGSGQDRVTNVPDVGPGDRVIGKIKGTRCWIIEWSGIAAGFIIAKVEGKPFQKMREYPSPKLKGFFPETANPDGNHKEYRFLRYAGFGVSDRVAALVYRIGNASYAIPSGYTAPLPV